MSAFVVDKTHLDVLLSAGLSWHGLLDGIGVVQTSEDWS